MTAPAQMVQPLVKAALWASGIVFAAALGWYEHRRHVATAPGCSCSLWRSLKQVARSDSERDPPDVTVGVGQELDRMTP